MQLHLPDGRVITFEQPRIMGILNVTPDSFSDGGAFVDESAALARAADMLDEGADVIDIGGESTRPGAQRVAAAQQIARTQRIVAAVYQLIVERNSAAAISIDTTRAAVAQAALDAGAQIINDVSAGRDDAQMFSLAVRRRVPLILMHMLAEPATMQVNPAYTDVVAQVKAFLLERARAAEAAGVARDRIVIDPGIGFGKTLEHNLALLAHLDELVATGYPVLLGASRKRFLPTVCGLGDAAAPAQLAAATCATTALGVAAGVQLFRVHDVAVNRIAAQVARAVKTSRTTPAP
jgi:dihydropteroate synthase